MMKKVLLTLAAVIAMFGTVSAQYHSDIYDHQYVGNAGLGDYDYVIPFIQIDGEYLSLEDNYEAFELGAFINGQVRGGSFLIDDGEDYPFTEISVYRPEGVQGETITFKLYDHEHGIEYVGLTTLVNGQDYDDLYVNWTPEYTGVPVLNFTLAGIDLRLNVDQWYLIASPVGTVDVADVNAMLDNTYDLYYFNQAPEIVDGIGLEWINYRPEDAATNPEFEPQFTELVAGHGYLYANSGDGEHTTVKITFPGSAYEGENVTVDLDYSTANPVENMRGWNLVGNPFNMQATIGDYPFYRMIEGVLMPDVCTGAIEAMEGVFVKASAEGENVTFAPYQSKKRAMLALNLTESGRLMDRAIVGFGEGRTLPKFQLNQNSSKVYITLDNEDYAVVRSEGMGELPVSFKAEANGNYSLSFSSEDVDFSYLHLIDNMTGADVDLLATPSYSFDARTTDYASRFRLVFATGSNADGDSFGFVNASGNLCIFGIEGEATLQVMDVTGRILSTETFSGSYEKQLNAAPGVYMLRLTNGNNVKVQKMVVR